MSNGGSGAGAAAARGDEKIGVTGFIHTTSDDICKQNALLAAIRDRLDQLGGRLIGVDQLPRNKKPQDELLKPKSDRPEPVMSDSEHVTRALRDQRELIQDLEEITIFLEQL